MNTSDTARKMAERIVKLSSIRGISVNRMLSLAGLSKSVVDRMKLGNMPSADKLSAIAEVLDVPVEYLLGSGVFEKWDLLLEHKTSVLNAISGMMADLSKSLLYGVDDLTFARLVSIFKVDLEEGSDPAGTEILVISPFPTYEAPEPANPEPARLKVEEAPAPDLSENEREMMKLYKKLPGNKQSELIGYTRRMVEEQRESESRQSSAQNGKVG